MTYITNDTNDILLKVAKTNTDNLNKPNKTKGLNYIWYKKNKP
jgi:hypothetical protein